MSSNAEYKKPERWHDPANKLFPKQVGFTSPPHDFDAAPTDFLRIAPETVGAHGRMLHVPEYGAGYCLVEALQELGIHRVALNAVYYWPDWRDGIAGFLRQAGIDLAYVGNFVDLGLYATQQQVNDLTWVFPGDKALESMRRTVERAGDIDALLVNGMPNFRRADGLPQRMVSLTPDIEADIGMPVISSDTALYWRIFKTLGEAPTGDHGKLLESLHA